MVLENIDIHDLLPQQEPFVMIDKLVHFDERATVTALKIRPENIFVANGILSPSGIIENIAQTCAARIGYVNKYILKKGIQIGFIGAVRNLVLHRLPRAGEEIISRITVMEEVFGMTLVSANVTAGEETIAEAEMKIALSDEEQHTGD